MRILRKMTSLRNTIRNQVYVLTHYGISGLVDEFLNRRRAWSILNEHAERVGRELGGATSVTDVNSYLTICNLAAGNASIFERFRSCIEYREILEHVTREQGQLYFDVLKRNQNIMERAKRLVTDDTGSPFRYSYSGIGRISPTSLRYAKVLTDLEQLFGNLDKFVVSEIGIGFGGQCVQICNTWDIAKYELFDLEPVLNLAGKYIHGLIPTAPIDRPELKSCVESRDLLISNYAFSELTREVQETYLQLVTSSSRGYVTYNDMSLQAWENLSAQEFASRIPGAEIFREYPLTYRNNVLVVWGHQGQLES